jgi:hypothetical protein
MTRQTMINQIVTMTTAGMINRNEIPDNKDEFFSQIEKSCSSIMQEPPSDNEIDIAFESEIPVEFAEILKRIAI